MQPLQIPYPQQQQHPQQMQFQPQQQQPPQQMQFQPQQQQHPQQTQFQQQQTQFQQQQHFSAQPGVTVVTQNPAADVYKLKGSALTQMKGLSITQAVMGGLCILFGIILIAIEASTYGSEISFIGYGIWSGIYFAVVGGIGLGAVRRNTRCWIVATMVLNIICSVIFFLPLLIMAAVGLEATNWCSSNYYSCTYNSADRAIMAFNSLLLIISIAELVITIWTAVLCCGAVCSCCLPTSPGHYVQYGAPTHQPQQQYMVYPGAAPNYQVNMGGMQVPVGVEAPTAPTLPHGQGLGGYDALDQHPPAYHSYEQPPSDHK